MGKMTEMMTKIRIRRASSEVVVWAKVFGVWAAHRNHDPFGVNTWCVTNVDTGVRIPVEDTGWLTHDDAVAIAKAVNDKLPVDVSRPDLHLDVRYMIEAIIAEELSE